MLSTDKQTNKQTDRQTNQRYQKHNLLCLSLTSSLLNGDGDEQERCQKHTNIMLYTLLVIGYSSAEKQISEQGQALTL